MTNFENTKALPAIADNRTLRFLFVFLLYLAQGVPFGLLEFAIPAWLVANGATPLEVGGYLAAVNLPWALKFVNGFIMDRYTFLPMGRRRAWLIGAHSAMVCGLVLLALVNPRPDNIGVLAAFAFAVQTFTTFQDVAVDGMAVDLIPDDERARANGLMFGGQAIGMASGAAFGGYAIAAAGLPAAMLGNAAFVAVFLMLVLTFRERPGERLLPWTQGQASQVSAARQVDAWRPLIRTVWKAMSTWDSAHLAIAQTATGVAYGLYVGVTPMIAINVAGWSDAEFSGLSGSAYLVAGVLGVLLFGVAVDKLGSRPSTILTFGLMAASVALFWNFEDAWRDDRSIQAAAFVFLSLYTLAMISICASAMKVCSLTVAATQFTLYMAISNLGIALASALLGPLMALGGYGAVMATMIVVAVTGAGAMYRFSESRMKRRMLSEVGEPAPA